MKFRAALLHKVGVPALSIETLDCAPPGPREVLVRMRASGLCHTDLEVMEGGVTYPVPIVLGHEGAGVVEAVGSEVTRVQLGDHVVGSWNPHCGGCYYCERDQPILCERYGAHARAGRLMDGTSRYSLDGKMVHHFTGVSSHGELSIMPESSAVPIPREIPFDRACLIGCGVMTGVGAVARLAQVPAGSSVAVIGAGAIGLNAIQGAVLQGAEIIVAIDRDARKLATARHFGATHVLGDREAEVLDQIKACTSGRGVDYAFECAGHPAAMQLSIEATRRGGSVVLLGKRPVNEQISVRFGSLMNEKRIVRSSYGNARPQRDFPWLAGLYLRGKLKLDELITQRLSLDTINDGFKAMRAGLTTRSVVVFP